MPKHRQSPGPHFEIIQTYKEFEDYIRAFATGNFNLLVVIGRPGISKSESIRRAVEVDAGTPKDKPRAEVPDKPAAKEKEKPAARKPSKPRRPRARGKKPSTQEGKIASQNVLYCKGGQLTPLEFFIQCFKHRHEPIILDDANAIMQKDIGKRLVMSLTESRPVKTLDYRTTNKLLEQEQVPTTFHTRSRVCYISNSWLADSAEAQALEDRAHLVWFNPPAKEVHLFTAAWFWDDDIFQYIGSRLHLIDEHSCRLYTRAAELKQAGMDWKRHIDRNCYGTHVRLFQELQEDDRFEKEEDRIKEWCRQTQKSRATYFNLKRELTSKGQKTPIKPEDLPPGLKAQGTPPPRPEEIDLPEDEEQVEGEDE